MKISKTDCLRTPKADGFYMPGEFEPHEGTLMIWPWRPGSWNYGAKAARAAFAEIAEAIAAYEQVYLFIRPQDKASAQELLSSDRIHLIEAQTEDAWARDTGATFVINNQGGRRGIQWDFNAWGGQYDGLYSHFEHDREVPERICSFLGDSFYNARPFVLEGGSIHVDGEGTLLTTEECLLSPGRNPSLTRAEIEEKLRQYLSVEKIIWLPFGIYNDETNGHIDNMCCFVKPGEVLLAWTDDENDPQYARSRSAFDLLSHTVDAKGRSFVIHKLPIPSIPSVLQKKIFSAMILKLAKISGKPGNALPPAISIFTLPITVSFFPGSAMKTIPWLQKFSENASRIDRSFLLMHASF